MTFLWVLGTYLCVEAYAENCCCELSYQNLYKCSIIMLGMMVVMHLDGVPFGQADISVHACTCDE